MSRHQWVAGGVQSDLRRRAKLAARAHKSDGLSLRQVSKDDLVRKSCEFAAGEFPIIEEVEEGEEIIYLNNIRVS